MTEPQPITPDPPGTRVSYAQNGEDVRLWRIFGHMDVGFYVEVGGWHPETYSISRSFYGRGWCGIVFEPVEEDADYFASRRPRDLVVRDLAGSQEGVKLFHVFEGTGLSTTSAEHAERHRSAGFSGYSSQRRVRRVADVLAEQGVPEIHFMTVDVEGAEAEILAGMDWERVRPWVLIIEATLPLTSQPSHSAWEPGLLDSGYVFAAFDGLNRFYVDRDHADLAVLLQAPPNPFDDFVLHREIQVAQERDEAQSAHESARRALATSERERDEAVRRLATALAEADLNLSQLELHRRQLAAVLSSRSWRVTSPLRALRGRPGRIGPRPKPPESE